MSAGGAAAPGRRPRGSCIPRRLQGSKVKGRAVALVAGGALTETWRRCDASLVVPPIAARA